MRQAPLVTVLMPCFNAMPFLPEALESIINQTYQNLEILCINDGSTDQTGEILEEYALKDKRIRVVHNEVNIKLIRTLNKGIDLANGEYIARMDADDVCYLDRIKISVDFLKLYPEIEILSPNKTLIDEKGRILGDCIVRNRSCVATYFASFLYASVGHPEVICKANVLKENLYKFTDDVLHVEDYEIWGRLMSMGTKIMCIDQPLLYYRINNNSVSRVYTDIQNQNFIIQANQFYNTYSNRNISTNLSKVISNRLDAVVNITEFKNGIDELKFFKNFYIKKEHILNEIQLQEIDDVFNTHLFDICFQALKKSNLSVKLIAVPILLKLLCNSLFDKTLRKYIQSKF